MTEEVKILAIESSCDETAAAVIVNGRKILSNIINSQISTHRVYGGVVPEIASRKHMENINTVVRMALKEADTDLCDIDAVAVTYGPGLVGALLVGISFAKALAFAADKPLIGVNHIEGHISANYLEDETLEPPFASLVVSGGHTYLAMVKEYGEYEIIGRTRDDAAGEAFDKTARALGLGYPGGPAVEKLARTGNCNAIDFPRAVVTDSPMDFSFSGIKSAVLNYLNSMEMQKKDVNAGDVAASFQKAVTDAITDRAVKMCKENNITRLAIAGGVAANTALRESLVGACDSNNIKIFMPSVKMCTDNAAMIGAAAYYKYIKKEFAGYDLNAVPGLGLTGKR